MKKRKTHAGITIFGILKNERIWKVLFFSCQKGINNRVTADFRQASHFFLFRLAQKQRSACFFYSSRSLRTERLCPEGRSIEEKLYNRMTPSSTCRRQVKWGGLNVAPFLSYFHLLLYECVKRLSRHAGLNDKGGEKMSTHTDRHTRVRYRAAAVALFPLLYTPVARDGAAASFFLCCGTHGRRRRRREEDSLFLPMVRLNYLSRAPPSSSSSSLLLPRIKRIKRNDVQYLVINQREGSQKRNPF